MTISHPPLPDSYTVRLIDLPVTVGGTISEDPDGHVNIYLNARLNDVQQHTSFWHEARHNAAGDLYSSRDIRDAERDADGSPFRAARRLPPLMRASELLRRQQRARRAAQMLRDLPDWKNDIYLSMPMYDDF